MAMELDAQTMQLSGLFGMCIKVSSCDQKGFKLVGGLQALITWHSPELLLGCKCCSPSSSSDVFT